MDIARMLQLCFGSGNAEAEEESRTALKLREEVQEGDHLDTLKTREFLRLISQR